MQRVSKATPSSERDRQLGQLVRERRKERGLTQAALAEHLGVSFQQIQKYERGVNALRVTHIDRLCRILGVEPLYFFPEYAAGLPRPAASCPEVCRAPS